MASTRARVAADALPEGRVTRSQAAQLPSGKRGGAEEDAAKARTRLFWFFAGSKQRRTAETRRRGCRAAPA